MLSSATSTCLKLRMTFASPGSSGEIQRRCACETALPCATSDCCACRSEPYVPPQPITSTSPDSGPWKSSSPISCAMRCTFSARTCVCFS